MALVKTQNAEGGSDARYDVSKMSPEERTQFDSEGRPLGSSFAPDQWVWTDGIIGARGGWGNSGNPNGGGGGGGQAGGGAFFEQLKSMLNSQSLADKADTRSAIQKALIAFGIDPTAAGQPLGAAFKDDLGALDDVTKSLIAKNTESGISYYARLMDQKKDNLKALVANLNKIGQGRSGTKGYKLRKGQLDFDRLFQDSLSEMLGQVGNMYKGYAGNEQNRMMQLLQAMQSGNMYSGAGSTTQGGGGGGGGGGGSTPPPVINAGTWAAGIDTGGYVPGSGKITDYGNQPTYNIGGGRIAS